MAIKIQYNKTALQHFKKQLDFRVKALPTLKSKEAALRVEVKKAKYEAERLQKLLDEKMQENKKNAVLWSEFERGLVAIKNVLYDTKKIAGIETPVIGEVEFQTKEFSVFNRPAWFLDGIDILKDLLKIALERDAFIKKMEILYHARKKTTQKVNLYEKVQIPEFEEAMRKIKRFLEDEENLSKSAQKIVKSRQQRQEVAA